MPSINFKYNGLVCILIFFCLDLQANNSSHLIKISKFDGIPKDMSLSSVRSANFDSVGHESINFTFDGEWKWLRVVPRSLCVNDFLLEIQRPDIDHISTFLIKETGVDSIIHFDNARHIGFSDVFFSYPLDRLKNINDTLFIRIHSNQRLIFPVSVISTLDHSKNKTLRQLLYGLFCGIMVVMVFYNLFIFLSTKNTIYIVYVLYVLSSFFAQASILGILQNYFWPSFRLNAISIQLFTGFVGLTGTYFAFTFLKISNYLNRTVTIYKVVIFLYLVTIFLALLGQPSLAYKFQEYLGSFASIFLMLSGILVLREGYKPALYFLIAWSAFLSGIFLFVLKEYEFMSISNWTVYTMPIGSALETILLSFALADRINTLKKEKEESQLKMFDEVRKNRDFVKNQNEILETMVSQRTKSLAITNLDLKRTLDHLKETQSQLVDAEKMASLGQLTAGIAHEINNPINFVTSNIEPLRRDINDILNILHSYQNYAQVNNDPELKSILNAANEIELDYSVKEIHDLLRGIDEGARRTSAIVNSLRTFSRSDHDSLSVANVNQGIESTLTLLKSEIGKVQVQLDLKDIQEVECYLGKLNQVFMNLIDNALDAVKEKYGNSSEAQIIIKSYEQENEVFVSIQDNGLGIPESELHKLFEPFFTTKEVGRGTGLGLSISYGIIEKHHGKISVTSELGKWTKFVITLPKSQAPYHVNQE